MYKSSNDRRFIKNKIAIRHAYMNLIMEKGYQKITVSDIAERADINRMTFYAHYDYVDDIFDEFVDEMESSLVAAISERDTFDLDYFFNLLNDSMYSEIEFFRHVANADNCADFREAFRQKIGNILSIDMSETDRYTAKEKIVLSRLASSCIAYAYLDWLAGLYGDMEIDEIIDITKTLLKDELQYIKFKKQDKD